MIATITKFDLHNWTLYGSFFVTTYRVFKQAKRSGGLIRMGIRPISLYTLTVWKTRDDMLRFRNNGAHLIAMKRSNHFGTIQSTTWETDEVPNWAQAMSKLSEK